MKKYTGVEIIKVTVNSQLRQFIGFPYQLYKNDPNWVPPLRITQHALFKPKHLFWQKNPHQLFIAVKNSRCAGRIAAFVNKAHNKHLNTADGFFGFLEAENDATVFSALLDAAAEFLKQHGCFRIIGPMNPDIHNELGVLVKGFDSPPYIMLTHHFPHYDTLIQQHGFSKLQDFFSYKMDAAVYKATEKMQAVSQRLLLRHGLHIRMPDMKKFGKELEHFHTIYNDSFADHWGFAPIPRDEFLTLAKDMKSIIDPRMVLIAELDNEPIAFVLSLPNINEILHTIKSGRLFPTGIFKLLTRKWKIGSVRVITAAVKKKYQHLGLGALLFPELMKRGLQYGYHKGELSWVAEDNKVMNAIAKQLAGEPYKTYRLYSANMDSFPNA